MIEEKYTKCIEKYEYVILENFEGDTGEENRQGQKAAAGIPFFFRQRQLCRSNHIAAIRLDTQEENKVMQHILDWEGFEYCGLIQFDGGPKLAYEWDG